MEFYNPMQRRTPRTEINSTAPTPSTYSAPGMSGQNRIGGGYGLDQQKLGNIDFQQAGTGQWGTGESFQGAGRTAILEAMTKGMSSANPEDYQGMDELRNYYRNQLADLPGQTADKISSFDTQSQRGLKNLNTQFTNSQAGTGRIGSRQYAGEQGNIYSKAITDYMNGLSSARSNAIGQANQIGSGLTGVQDQNMKERQFQADSSQRLSDMIYRLMDMDRGTVDKNAERAKEDRKNTMDLIKTGAQVGGAAIAGKPA